MTGTEYLQGYPELRAVVEAMAAHRPVTVSTAQVAIDPQTTVADTHLTVQAPGAPMQRDPYREPYTHCIHRYRVIGGDDITWVGPGGALGSTTRGAFGSEPADDDVIDALWAEILVALGIEDDPHSSEG